MSLSNALSNALSGLAAASRGTEVVASNLANATTPGFARRELQLTSRPVIAGGGGVQVEGVTRVLRNSVVAQGRLAEAETARAGTLAAFHRTLSDAVGVPGEAGALSTALSDFDSALLAAAARPENEMGLAGILSAGRTLAGAYNALGTQVQEARGAADRAIAADVELLNTGLGRVANLNRQIAVHLASGDDANVLLDERQRIVDGLSEIVPIKELPRENGRIALFTATGGMLLDGTTPARFDFSPAPVMTAEAVGTPALGLLKLNGEEVPPSQMGRFTGGRLAANFQIRDLDGPGAQASLDTAARDLHDRFAGAGLDPTLAAGAPGLFTDGGGAATTVPGLAQRLTINAAADPDAGGALWRLRDGLQAAAPGPVGNADLLIGMQEALGALRPSSLAGMSPAPRSAATLAADLGSWAASGRIEAERVLGGATAQSSTFEAMRQQDGVDSDREMETLLTLERAYASNAKVLQAVDEMLQTMLRLT